MKQINSKKIIAITIRQILTSGMKPSEVAKTLKVSRQLVHKWKNKDPLTPRKPRKFKLNRTHIKKLIELGEDKYTAINHHSFRKIAHKLNSLFEKRSKGKFRVSHTTINKCLKSCSQFPKKSGCLELQP